MNASTMGIRNFTKKSSVVVPLLQPKTSRFLSPTNFLLFSNRLKVHMQTSSMNQFGICKIPVFSNLSNLRISSRIEDFLDSNTPKIIPFRREKRSVNSYIREELTVLTHVKRPPTKDGSCNSVSSINSKNSNILEGQNVYFFAWKRIG